MISHLDQVLDCFVRMDVEGLRVLLQEPTYYDVPRDIFLDRLEDFFKSFIDESNLENSRLTYYAGSCCSKQCDVYPNRLGFKFHGYPDDYFDLRFILEKDEHNVEYVKDIFPCYHLVTHEFVDVLGTLQNFWVYEDDRVTFNKDTDYQIKVQQALNGFDYWEKKQDEQIITLEEIKSWLLTYEPIYLSIKPYDPSKMIFWKWDNFHVLFTYLDLLVRFVEDFRLDLERFSMVDVSEINHKDLIEWLLRIEKRMEDCQYWRLHGSAFMRLEQEACRGKLNFPLAKNLNLDPDLRQTLETFLNWFAEERKKWLDYYFALTATEYDQFMEQNTDEEKLFNVNCLLSFHLEIREKLRKQGLFIPFNLK